MITLAVTRRLQLTAILAVAGALVGAITAVVLSYLGTAVAQAFIPNGRVAYFFSPLQFAIAAAIGTPVLAWIFLRRVPLWRAISEPALGGVLGTLVALATVPLLPVAGLQAFLVPLGIVAAALRLRWVHRPDQGHMLGSGQNGLPTVAS